MSRYYSDPSRQGEKWALPDVEVFHLGDNHEDNSERAAFGTDEEPLAVGWYWWTCLPGCMPDSQPFGPFATEEEAVADAQRTD